MAVSALTRQWEQLCYDVVSQSNYPESTAATCQHAGLVPR